MRKGLDEESAAFLITLFVFGAVLGQLPSGWLADHVDHRRLLIGGSLTTLAALAAVPVAIQAPLLIWPVMLVMGASLSSFSSS